MFKLLELLHHFNKVNVTKFLRKYILVSEKQNILLLKNIGKILSDLEILIARDPSSLNYGPLKLLLHFTVS